ncbi:hypothetical protein DFP72DRAFT_1176572 [Ephemerocybe angulata]|uniref:F-box domain-containing protein n=1 Tax=Ephemerocybe angulata TaxID=980116 RepID=A0A8H6HFM4_9AGAR|nr:hypothetical protein DFP72DRAFT_1176572 [Tulosesus angulatus]
MDRVNRTSDSDEIVRLEALPTELLSRIVGATDWEDVLRLRQTSLRMREVSYDRDVWKEVFLRYLGTRIPRPFYLPKPLHACSSEDIEHAIISWEAPWPEYIPAKLTIHRIDWKSQILHPAIYNHGRFGRPYILNRSLCLIPGGRWLLFILKFDASLWYFDLSEAGHRDLRPRLLCAEMSIPGNLVKVGYMAVDLISAQLSSPGTYHLTEFNVAIAAPQCVRQVNSAEWHTRITVCSIEVVFEPDVGDGSAVATKAVGLRVSRYLSRYIDKFPSPSSLSFFCLLGGEVAYKVEMRSETDPEDQSYAVIVEWKDANGNTSGEDLLRRYIPVPSLQHGVLLPESRILVTTLAEKSPNLMLYRWRDVAIPSMHPLQGKLFENATPSWQGRVDLNFSFPDSLWYMSGDIRLVTDTVKEGVYGIRVLSSEDQLQKSSETVLGKDIVSVEQLAKAIPGQGGSIKILAGQWEGATCQYHRRYHYDARLHKSTASHYSWLNSPPSNTLSTSVMDYGPPMSLLPNDGRYDLASDSVVPGGVILQPIFDELSGRSIFNAGEVNEFLITVDLNLPFLK